MQCFLILGGILGAPFSDDACFMPSISVVRTWQVGYSLMLYLPAAVFAVAHVLAWPAIAMAGAAATTFLVRSLKPLMEPKREKAASVKKCLVGSFRSWHPLEIRILCE